MSFSGPGLEKKRAEGMEYRVAPEAVEEEAVEEEIIFQQSEIVK